MAHFVQPTSYEQIGNIQKIKGLAGDMIAILKYPHIVMQPTIVYLYQHHTYVPYQVNRWQTNGKYAQVHLKDINTRSAAMHWQDHNVFANAAIVQQALAQTHISLIGYKVHDVHQGTLGRVSKVEQGLQALLHIAHKGSILLIPMHDAFIQELDSVKKRITTHLPAHYWQAIHTSTAR